MFPSVDPGISCVTVLLEQKPALKPALVGQYSPPLVYNIVGETIICFEMNVNGELHHWIQLLHILSK